MTCKICNKHKSSRTTVVSRQRGRESEDHRPPCPAAETSPSHTMTTTCTSIPTLKCRRETRSLGLPRGVVVGFPFSSDRQQRKEKRELLCRLTEAPRHSSSSSFSPPVSVLRRRAVQATAGLSLSHGLPTVETLEKKILVLSYTIKRVHPGAILLFLSRRYMDKNDQTMDSIETCRLLFGDPQRAVPAWVRRRDSWIRLSLSGLLGRKRGGAGRRRGETRACRRCRPGRCSTTDETLERRTGKKEGKKRTYEPRPKSPGVSGKTRGGGCHAVHLYLFLWCPPDVSARCWKGAPCSGPECGVCEGRDPLCLRRVFPWKLVEHSRGVLVPVSSVSLETSTSRQ